MRKSIAALGVLAGTAIGGAALGSEQKIPRSALPAAVERTVSAEHADAARGFSKEVKNGQTLYEAELTVNGRRRDLLIDATGRIVEVEEEVSLESLPPAVQRGLRAAAEGGKLVRIESITRNDRVVAYEAEIDVKGKRSEVQVGSDGRRLGHAP